MESPLEGSSFSIKESGGCCHLRGWRVLHVALLCFSHIQPTTGGQPGGPAHRHQCHQHPVLADDLLSMELHYCGSWRKEFLISPSRCLTGLRLWFALGTLERSNLCILFISTVICASRVFFAESAPPGENSFHYYFKELIVALFTFYLISFSSLLFVLVCCCFLFLFLFS